MKLQRLKNIKIPEVSQNVPDYAERKTPTNMPRLHYLSAVIGSRNSGKTTACIRMLKMYVNSRSYDKIFWFSPTARREPKMKAFIQECEGKCEVEIIDKFDPTDFEELVEYFREEIDDYKEYKKQLAVWKKYKDTDDVDKLSHDELIMLEEMDYEKPKTEYKHGFPSFCVVFDDMIGDKNVFSPTCKGATSNFFILHRHVSCSCIVLSQIVSNGLPRQIRGNISLWLLFSCKSEKLKTDVANELAFRISPEKFHEIWDFSTKEPHSFLMCDYDCPEEKYMFRRNFTDMIIWRD